MSKIQKVETEPEERVFVLLIGGNEAGPHLSNSATLHDIYENYS